MIYKGRKYKEIVNKDHPQSCSGCIFEEDISICFMQECVHQNRDNNVYHWYVYYPELSKTLK